MMVLQIDYAVENESRSGNMYVLRQVSFELNLFGVFLGV